MPAVYETAEEQPLTTHLSNALQNVPLADVLSIPNNRIVSIEHPCVIRNLDNGIKSMGGEQCMKHVLEHHVGDSLLNPQKPKAEPELGVSLRPEDPLAQKIPSIGVDTRNVLIKITVPRRTGRKRKRGTQDSFDFAGENKSTVSHTAPEVLKRLRDNEGKYSIEAVGMVQETHRFRGLPDLQSIASDIPIFQELTAHILKPQWSSLKDFSMDMSVGHPTMTSLPGPPSFAATTLPYRYEYQQAAGVRFSRDEDGRIKSLNLQAPARKIMKPVAPDVAEVPTGPPPGLKAHNPYSAFLPRVIKGLGELLDQRPLVTRRVAMNTMPDCNESVFREAIEWVAYSFKAGPFRDTLIKYGVDPRKDPKYRKYQTLMFQLDKRAAKAQGETSGKWNRTVRHIPDAAQPPNTSHIFDGENVSINGKTWQICDLTDPILKQIFDTENIQPECDVWSYGWYQAGTICKARLIMREKMEKLFEGTPVPNEVYSLLATMPDNIDDFTAEHAAQYFGDSPSGKEAATLASEIRSMVRAGQQGYRRAAEAKDNIVRGELEDPAGDEEMQGDLDM